MRIRCTVNPVSALDPCSPLYGVPKRSVSETAYTSASKASTICRFTKPQDAFHSRQAPAKHTATRTGRVFNRCTEFNVRSVKFSPDHLHAAQFCRRADSAAESGGGSVDFRTTTRRVFFAVEAVIIMAVVVKNITPPGRLLRSVQATNTAHVYTRAAHPSAMAQVRRVRRPPSIVIIRSSSCCCQLSAPAGRSTTMRAQQPAASSCSTTTDQRRQPYGVSAAAGARRARDLYASLWWGVWLWQSRPARHTPHTARAAGAAAIAYILVAAGDRMQHNRMDSGVDRHSTAHACRQVAIHTCVARSNLSRRLYCMPTII
jgi:hypothetical protein